MMRGASGAAAEAARLVAAFAGAEGLERLDQVALRLRYDPGHLRQMCHGAGPNGRSRHELFRRIWSAWPQGAEKPRELRQWERDHPRARRDVICETGRIRRCIACGEAFLSEGAHHRLCRRHRAARVVEPCDIAVHGGFEMHAARITRSDRLRRVLIALQAAGGELSIRDIILRAGLCAVNSCVAELRANGAEILCRQEVKDGRRRWFYRLVKGPERFDA